MVSKLGITFQTENPAESKLFDCRDAYARTLEEMAEQDTRVCAVINDSLSSAKLKNFRTKFPDRFINIGIAEQNMVGVGNGLANAGMVPYLCGASCFLTARAMEQVKVDLAYSNANVRICGMSSGMAYGQLGPTHHSVEDIAWMRILPNLAVIVAAAPWRRQRSCDIPWHTRDRCFSASAGCQFPRFIRMTECAHTCPGLS